jgi:PKD repeat protein
MPGEEKHPINPYLLADPYPTFVGELTTIWDNAYRQDQYNGHTGLTWKWTLPNGSFVHDAQFTWIFNTPGSFEIRLDVAADGGYSGSTVGTIEVFPAGSDHQSADGLCDRTEWVEICWGRERTVAGEPQGFVGRFFGENGTYWSWDFGDNHYKNGVPEVNHTFQAAGTYLIELRVNSDGHQYRLEVQFTVDPTPKP